MKKKTMKMVVSLLALLVLAVSGVAFATEETFNTLSFTKYSDGSLRVKITSCNGGQIYAYAHLTSAQRGTIQGLLIADGDGTAPTNDFTLPLIPTKPSLGSVGDSCP